MLLSRPPLSIPVVSKLAEQKFEQANLHLQCKRFFFSREINPAYSAFSDPFYLSDSIGIMSKKRKRSASDNEEEQPAEEEVEEEEEISTPKVKTGPVPGVIYLSRIPNKMNVTTIRSYFDQYGQTGRIYLELSSK